MDGSPVAPASRPTDLGRCAMLVVDVQRYDADPDWGVGPSFRAHQPQFAAAYFERVGHVVVPNIIRLRDRCRTQELPIVYTMSGAGVPDGSDLSRARRIRFAGSDGRDRSIFHRDEPEYRLVPELEPSHGELVLHKSTVSAFNSSPLDLILRNQHVVTLLVAGVVTDGCVDSTARDASDLGYEVIIVADATAAWRPEWHDQALATFARYWGSVATTDEVCAWLRERSS